MIGRMHTPTHLVSLGKTLAIVCMVWMLSLFVGADTAYACDPDMPGSTKCYDFSGGAASPVGSPDGAFQQRALFLLDYSLGINNDNNCFSCRFVQQFLLALSSFSAAVFMYFRAFFVVLMPIILSIWIGWSVGRLMIAGGDGGKDFFSSMVKKLSLFLMLWLVMMAGGPTGTESRDPSTPMTVIDAYEPWTWFGPELLRYGFELGNEVRDTAGASLATGGKTVARQLGMNCRGIGRLNETLAENPEAYEFAFHASEMACAIERTHIVGIAAGLAMIEGAWTTVTLATWPPSAMIYNLFSALLVTVFGLIIIFVFSLSMIWFVFLLLDVVVKGLVIAAIAPILMVMALLANTRSYAINAVKQSVGGVATLLGVAFISALAFYLIANTVEVFNTAKDFYSPGLAEIPNVNTVADLREFVRRVMTDDADKAMDIPMDISTPWFHYMLLTSMSIFVLGKKVISIIESIVGTSGLSEMADSAKKIAVMGAALAGSTAYFGGKGAWWGMGAAKKGIAGGWGAASSIKAGLSNAYNEIKTAPSYGDLAKSLNPFANAASTGAAAVTRAPTGNTFGDVLRNTMSVKSTIEQGLDDVSGDQPTPR